MSMINSSWDDARKRVFAELDHIEELETEKMLSQHLAENDRQARNRISYAKYIEPLAEQFQLHPEVVKDFMKKWGAHV